MEDQAINDAWALIAMLSVAALLCVPFARSRMTEVRSTSCTDPSYDAVLKLGKRRTSRT